jgi:hypothetical protein
MDEVMEQEENKIKRATNRLDKIQNDLAKGLINQKQFENHRLLILVSLVIETKKQAKEEFSNGWRNHNG